MLRRELKRKLAIALTIATAMCMMPSQQVSAASTLVPNGWYYIKNVNSQKYIEVAGGVDANGTNVYQSPGSDKQ